MITEIVLFLVGIIVGSMNAIAGGGMLLGFPVLLAAGLTPLVANVTTYIIILPGQIASVVGYRDHLRKLSKRYLVLLIPIIIGAGVGAHLLKRTSSAQFEQLFPALILFAVLLFAFQPFLNRHLRLHISRRRSTQSLWIVALALIPMAMYGGYFGAGFGFIMLAFLSFTKLHEIHMMNGLKNVAGLTIALVCIFSFFGSNLVDWPHGLAMAAGNGLGGYYGARLSQRVSSHAIRIGVIAIGLISATYLCFRAY